MLSAVVGSMVTNPVVVTLNSTILVVHVIRGVLNFVNAKTALINMEEDH